jgi:hypothetical protein
MTTRTLTPLEAIGRGAVAGAIGTLAMDLIQYAQYRKGGGDDPFVEWEFGGPEDFDEAGTPAKVGRRLYEAFTEKELPGSAAPLTNNVVHWATGAQWGSLLGLASGSMERVNPGDGLVLGTAAWGAAYGGLGAAGFYQPIWEYETDTLLKDLGVHLVFGVVTATAFRLLTLGRDTAG